MNSLSIRVQIGGREYPMRVSREEEHLLRKGARALDLEVKRYAKEFSTHDYRDMLAMIAFDLMVEKLRRLQASEAQAADTLSHIRRLRDLLPSTESPAEDA